MAGSTPEFLAQGMESRGWELTFLVCSLYALRLLKTAVFSVDRQEKDEAGEREVAKKKKKKKIYIYTHTYSSPGRAETDFITRIKLACILQQSMQNCSSIGNLKRISTAKCEEGLVLVILSVPYPHLHPDVLFSAFHCAWEAHLSRLDLPDQRDRGTLKKSKGGSKEGVFTSKLLRGCLLLWGPLLGAPLVRLSSGSRPLTLSLRAATAPPCSWSRAVPSLAGALTSA